MDTTQSLATISQPGIPAQASYLEMLGQAANTAAQEDTLEKYQKRKAAATTRRQAADVRLFAVYLILPLVAAYTALSEQISAIQDIEEIIKLLAAAGILVPDMANHLELWKGVTWGLVEEFVSWSLSKGYSLGSINVRLSTIKTYCKLAAKAGYLDKQEYTMIKTVDGFKGGEGRNEDEKRDQRRHVLAKKAEPVSISLAHARLLKRQPGTKKGRRDTLLICLLLDHGLRCGEISDLNVSALDLAGGTLTFYRHKVGKTQTHQLTADTFLAAQAYLKDMPSSSNQDTPLFTGSCSKERLSERTINSRIGTLGKAIGLMGLSPHDCRHYWATNAVRNGTDIKSLQDAGGWSSPAMPLRYAESSKIANQGVTLAY